MQLQRAMAAEAEAAREARAKVRLEGGIFVVTTITFGIILFRVRYMQTRTISDSGLNVIYKLNFNI